MNNLPIISPNRFLSSYDVVEENPLSVIAKQFPESAIALMDRLSIRQRETSIALARATSLADIAQSHCATIASAVHARPDMDHFRATTIDTEGTTGFFFGRSERRFRKITTQLDMW
ncbi:hypothetical protein KKC83_05685 [Patescibacteria group bacterium]|nr:hypothetical protein [Candidatus Falkowbacteria bacterium]MBU3906595.1 hypothetical protein [Patescibacteria group bacterium]MCG2698722.1 hypothetical protein [Candidatus Parcubacteria bacterium]MBU4014583.1 hypothetical protein [Patescibacteria group bacterium]MBU4027007.1 hypothetical protein [Patescibacteria group bacterium]